MMIATARSSKPKAWNRPILAPKPTYVKGISQPVAGLGSSDKIQWFFSMNPSSLSDIQLLSEQHEGWNEVLVPGEVAMQGYDIENDTPYFYKAHIPIPLDYKGNKIMIRFHGVYSKAQVWVNGAFIRSHQGGFTTWDCDITAHAIPGQAATVVVEFIDDIWDPSIGSFYAHHNMGGILRSVELIAIPHTHLTRLHYEVDFDDDYVDAQLKITLGAALGHSEDAHVRLELCNHEGTSIPLGDHQIAFHPDLLDVDISFQIEAPHKWDAEHPYLYTLQAKLYDDQQQLLEAAKVNVGFRKIAFRGMNGTDPKEVYVNGQRIKLRGTCRHSIHPTLGRTTTPELDIQDVKMLREQNVNYVRTSHYPPSEEFLAACDALGMYVEEETAVNFQYANGSGPWRDDEAWYMDQLAEMIERDRSHPSVLIWSLANESGWPASEEGNKFRRQFQYVREEEPSRPTKFSYPFAVEDGSATDIYSAHYAHYTEDLSHFKVNAGKLPDHLHHHQAPVLHDEYAHIACYNLPELERDSNVRNFWGESIAMFWESIVNTNGALGGALWANIDDTFLLPDGVPERHQQHSIGSAAGYGEWGNMSDTWRREKPEYWLTKKAYSPVRIPDLPLGNPGKAPITIAIKNWFNHTNLNEIMVLCSIHRDGVISEEHRFIGPDVKPFEEGQLRLPLRQWDNRECVHLKFQAGDGLIVDEYILPIAKPTLCFPDESYGPLILEESEDYIHIRNEAVSAAYDKRSAKLIQATYHGDTLMTGGPHLHATGEDLGDWVPEEIHAEASEDGQQVTITTTGHYAPGLKVQFIQMLTDSGRIETCCTLLDGQFEQALEEFGLSFDLPDSIAYVEWEKSGLHSVYPDNHIGRLSGRANRVREGSAKHPDRYGERPAWDWKEDMRNYYQEQKDDPLKGITTHDFKTMRESIYCYCIGYPSIDAILRVESDGSEAARVHYAYQQPLLINDTDTSTLKYIGSWSHGKDPKCYRGTETYSNEPQAKVEFSFYGTGIHILLKKHKNTGNMRVKLDDLPANILSTHSDIGMPLYQRVKLADLPLGQHKIIVEVPEDNEQAYVILDAFEVINDTIPPRIDAKLIINHAWNYEALGWGNYGGKPIKLAPGYSYSSTVRMTNNTKIIKTYES